MDVLIVKLGALGDVINTLPLAITLKEQLDARIHWLVAPLSYPLLGEHDAVDHPILFDSRRGVSSTISLLRELRTQSYDIVLDLQRILKSGLICYAVRGNRTIGFDKKRCKEMTGWLPFERIPAADPQAHMVHQYLEFARYLGLHETPVEWRIRTSERLPENLPEKFVVLNIGATKPANRWTVQGFSQLARMIHLKYQLPSVLTGGPEDGQMAEAIQALADDAVCNRVGRTNLRELVSILDASICVVTCDTGPMHLAVALGKKVIALFGPSDHRRTGPFYGQVVRAQMDCAPCNRKRCMNPGCMEAISVDDVLELLSSHI